MSARYPSRKRMPSKRKREEEEDVASEGSEEPTDGFIKPKLMNSCYDFEHLLATEEFVHEDVVRKMSADEFTMDYIKTCGLKEPLIFREYPEALGMVMPPADQFTVRDVMAQVGDDRRIEVVEVGSQGGKSMNIREFIEYYEKPEDQRNALWNVLSLEFSGTELAETVKPPKFLGDLDWVAHHWPRELKERQKINQEVHGATCDFSTYPRVQRYCLMSVKGCYTDFHYDFGGTSVWYHVLKGAKIFWMMDPSEQNFTLYEEWLRSNGHDESFFGKVVEKCTRIRVEAGNTLVIPSGWIHSVYTPEDSLVFGGNFLHSYAIPMQLRVARSEERIRIGLKYRYPFFKQMMWYYMEHIVRNATGRQYKGPIVVDPRVPVTVAITGENEASNAIAAQEHPHPPGGLEESDDELPDEPYAFYDDPCSDDFIVEPDANRFLPLQRRINMTDYQDCAPSMRFDMAFIDSLPQHEREGLFALLKYAKRLVKNKKPDFAEGITRPRHLFAEFQNVLSKCLPELWTEHFGGEQSRTLRQRRTRQQSRASVESNGSIDDDEDARSKDASKQRKRAAEKKPAKPTKHKKGEELLPPPIAGDDAPQSNPEYTVDGKAYCPMDEALPLGKKPLPSAFRKTSNMAEKPKANPLAYKARNLQPTHDKDVPDESVENETASQEKKVIATSHHPVRAAKRPPAHHTGAGLPEFEYRSPLGPSTSVTTTAASLTSPRPQQQNRNRSDSFANTPRATNGGQRRSSMGAESQNSFANSSFGSATRPFGATGNRTGRQQRSFNANNFASQQGPRHTERFPYTGANQAFPSRTQATESKQAVAPQPTFSPPSDAAPASAARPSPDVMFIEHKAPPVVSGPPPLLQPAPVVEKPNLLPEPPKEESKMDILHAVDLISGISNEIDGADPEAKKPLDPAACLDAISSIQDELEQFFN